MFLLFAFLLGLAQADSLPQKWGCGEKSDRVSDKQVTRLKTREMDQRVVS